MLSYADPATPSAIRALSANRLRIAFDAVSSKESTTAVLDCMSNDEAPKDVILLLPIQEEVKGIAETKSASMRQVIVYSLYAKTDIVVWGFPVPASQENYDFSVRCYEMLEGLLRDGKLKHQKIKLMGGLESVEEGFQCMKDGQVRGEKIVYRPMETKE